MRALVGLSASHISFPPFLVDFHAHHVWGLWPFPLHLELFDVRNPVASLTIYCSYKGYPLRLQASMELHDLKFGENKRKRARGEVSRRADSRDPTRIIRSTEASVVLCSDVTNWARPSSPVSASPSAAYVRSLTFDFIVSPLLCCLANCLVPPYPITWRCNSSSKSW